MLNKSLLFKLKRFLFFKINFYFIKNFKIEFNDYNFQNVVFEDLEFHKKNFFSFPNFNKINERNIYEYSTFNFLKIGRILGGAESVKISKKHIIDWYFIKKKLNSASWSDYIVTKRYTKKYHFTHSQKTL